MTETIAILLALIGHAATLSTDLGDCTGVVIAPGQAVVSGTCALTPAPCALTFDVEDGASGAEGCADLVSARTLESGRVVVTFRDGGSL